jgi:hypothetical protein
MPAGRSRDRASKGLLAHGRVAAWPCVEDVLRARNSSGCVGSRSETDWRGPRDALASCGHRHESAASARGKPRCRAAMHGRRCAGDPRDDEPAHSGRVAGRRTLSPGCWHGNPWARSLRALASALENRGLATVPGERTGLARASGAACVAAPNLPRESSAALRTTSSRSLSPARFGPLHAAPRNGENRAWEAGERLAPERVLAAAALRKHAPSKDLRETRGPRCSSRAVVDRSAFGRSVANSGLLDAKRAGARRVHG